MYYVASVIKFNEFLELLWKNTLLVCSNLNRFRPPWVKPVLYSCTLFGLHASVVLLYKMVAHG